MDKQVYIDKIENLLKELEERGELVVTSTIPQYISKSIFHSIVEEMLKNTEESDFIIECDIPYLLEQISAHLSSVFCEDIKNARRITNAFYNRLLERLNMQEVAELIHHETPFEIALRSYYCIELHKPDTRDLEYLDWRKKYYNQR